MNTPTEALEFTLNVLEKLKLHGIKVTTKESVCANDIDFVEEKKLDPSTIPATLWRLYSLHHTTQDQRQKISEATKYLVMCGISFDTGGCDGQYDWELDWSFRFRKGYEDWDKMEGLEWLDDQLTHINDEI